MNSHPQAALNAARLHLRMTDELHATSMAAFDLQTVAAFNQVMVLVILFRARHEKPCEVFACFMSQDIAAGNLLHMYVSFRHGS
jgi:hypothetical protein